MLKHLKSTVQVVRCNIIRRFRIFLSYQSHPIGPDLPSIKTWWSTCQSSICSIKTRTWWWCLVLDLLAHRALKPNNKWCRRNSINTRSNSSQISSNLNSSIVNLSAMTRTNAISPSHSLSMRAIITNILQGYLTRILSTVPWASAISIHFSLRSQQMRYRNYQTRHLLLRMLTSGSFMKRLRRTTKSSSKTIARS